MLFHSLVPNILVANVDRSLTFYRDVLGFSPIMTNPPQPPLMWAMIRRDSATLMLQDRSLLEEIPQLKDRPIGGSLTFYSHVGGLKELYDSFDGKVAIVMPWKTTFYGMNEFGIQDPDGYVHVFAEQAT